MSSADSTVVLLPKDFRRYPCPLSNSALAGTIEVDLGTWLLDDKQKRIHLRVNCEKLPSLIKKIAKKNGRSKNFGGHSIQIFVVAG